MRPLIFAEDAHLQVRPSMRYRLLVFTSPVTNYYNREAGAVSLKAQSRYTRAAPGGVGFAKTGGNYAAALFPATESIAEGFDQALWLDGTEHRYVEEVGQMNIFFDFEGRVATPELRGTILPGITRESVLTLLADHGIEVEERRIAIDEVIRRSEDGSLREAFGAGTAAVITPIGRIGFEGGDVRDQPRLRRAARRGALRLAHRHPARRARRPARVESHRRARPRAGPGGGLTVPAGAEVVGAASPIAHISTVAQE